MGDENPNSIRAVGDVSRGTTERLIALKGRLITERQLMQALFRMRNAPLPWRFAGFLGRYEHVLFPVLYRHGWTRSPATTAGYIEAFDVVYGNWVKAQYLPQADDVILAALPNGTGFIGRRSQYQAALQHLQAQRFLQTGRNIAAGPVGTLGYLLGGDAGSDLGALVDGAISSAGLVLQARNQFRALSEAPIYKPEAAMIAPQAGSRATGAPATGGAVGGPAGSKPQTTTAPTPAPKPVTPPPPATAAAPSPPPPLPAPVTPAPAPAQAQAPTPPTPAPAPSGGAPATPGTPQTKAQRFIQSFGGRLQDPNGALVENFRRSGAENRLHARGSTPELATIDHYMDPAFRGLGGRHVAQLVAVKPLSAGRSPDFVVIYTDGSAHRVEITTATSAAGRGPALKASGTALVKPTTERSPTQASFESRLYDKGVVVPGKKPLQLSVAHEAAGPGGTLMIFATVPTPTAVTDARNAMIAMGPRLSPNVWRVEFGLWGRTSPSAPLRRTYLIFERQPNGTYLELPQP